MKITNYSITFHTEKLKECVDFYLKYFGAKITFDAGWYVTIRLESNENVPLFLSFQGNKNEDVQQNFAGGVTLNLMVEDVDACYHLIKPARLPLIEEITDHEWGDRAFRLYDPIGNVLYIYSVRELDEKYKSAVKE
ncbi:MAG: VOC family protein [Bacteroides sp.]|jgi:uncharacterized glyoxalase superfamily protein PhnB|nr:VOC family protein [Bacteroides sp.]